MKYKYYILGEIEIDKIYYIYRINRRLLEEIYNLQLSRMADFGGTEREVFILIGGVRI